MKLESQNNPLNLTQEKEDVYIKLNCRDCDFVECCIHPCGRAIIGKEGCTRKVSEEIAAQFYHYIEEIIPF